MNTKLKKPKINLAKSAGFCFGVKRAIKIAEKNASCNRHLEMLGPIVHNEEVINDIEKMGIQTVKKLEKGNGKALLVRAHGIPLKMHKKAESLNYKIIDATCPMVKQIHNIAARIEKEGRRVIIIGDKNHAEVKGIAGHIKGRALIVAGENDARRPAVKKIKKAGVVVQSTQNVEKAKKIIAILKEQIKDIKIFNTICGTTKNKQKEIKTMPVENDVVIIIGSKTSANTKRLYEISKSINKKSYQVQSEKELKRIWFESAANIGVTAGASTPAASIKRVMNKIKFLLSETPAH